MEESESLRNQLDQQGFAVATNLDSISSNRSFDAVLLIEVIEHVPDPVGFLDHLRRCLDLEGPDLPDDALRRTQERKPDHERL